MLLRKSLLKVAIPAKRSGHELYIWENGFLTKKFAFFWTFGVFALSPILVAQSAWYFYCAPGMEQWEPMKYPNAKEMEERERNPSIV